MSDVRPFEISIADDQIADLKRRLAYARWVEEETVDDWSQGVPLSYLRPLCDYWLHRYDWRQREVLLNRFPQFQTEIHGLNVHFIHVHSPVSEATPLIMTHGWPGSVVEFQKVIGPLTNPVQYGGDEKDAFHLVCPSLPGYGFSAKPTELGWGLNKIADTWSELMLRLGYHRYFAQGGDWGAMVSTCMGSRDPDHCQGIHLNMAIAPPTEESLDDLDDFEKASISSLETFERSETAYAKQQGTRPQTLGYGLVDSPVGQAAWIMEKFYRWTDCMGNPENILTRDELLDNVMLYWLPATGASSARLYWESTGSVPEEDVTVPVGVSVFPKEILKPSRRWCEARYANLVYYNRPEKGGHFAAFEQPDLFVEEIRAAFRAMRN